MSQIKTLVLIGGISRESLNERLFDEILKHYSGKLSFLRFAIEKLPYFSQDLEKDPPSVVKEFRAMISDAQAILLITPEYNRSFPGVLKNALDWGSRPYGQNAWNGKPTAIMGASIGTIGTFGAQNHLRAVCSYLNMYIMNQPEFYGNASVLLDDKGLTEKSLPFVQKYMENFENWISHFYISK
jgi:chromate reductase